MPDQTSESSQPSKIQQMPEGLPDKERAEWLKWAIEYEDSVRESEDEFVPLPQADIDIIRRYTSDECGEVRAAAVKYLAENEIATWEELEAWAVDSNKRVRDEVAWAIEYDSRLAGGISSADKQRYVKLLSRTVQLFADIAAGNALGSLARKGVDWLELVWAEVERLADIGNSDVNTVLVVCLIEHIVPDNEWGPDDVHIQHWMHGTDSRRKWLLLETARWTRLREGRLRWIAEALVQDSDGSIAAAAKSLLSRDAEEQRASGAKRPKMKRRKAGHPKRTE